MGKKHFTIAAVAATVLMMTVNIAPVKAQLLYQDSHLFVGQQPANTTASWIGAAPNVIIGPKFGIEHNYSGLNFYILYPNTNWGDYHLFLSETGRVGIGRNPSSYKLEVNGQVWTTGGLLTTSDATQKRNVADMELKRLDYVTRLKQLKGKTYEKLIESGNDNEAEIKRMVAAGKIPKEEATKALAELNARKKDVYKSEYGFIAQDVKALFPELVEENAEGVLAVNYTGLIPVLLEGIKDLQEKVDAIPALLKTIKDLQDRIEKLEKIQAVAVTKSSPANHVAEGIVADNEYLSQNAPNPVDGSTTIRYSLPKGATQASIMVYSIAGSVIKTIHLDVKSKSGRIILYAADLAKGVNYYNLTVNGIVLETKQMINP